MHELEHPWFGRFVHAPQQHHTREADRASARSLLAQGRLVKRQGTHHSANVLLNAWSSEQ